MNNINQLTDDLGIFVRLQDCPFRLGQYANKTYIICNVKITPEDFVTSDWEYFSYNTTIDKIPSKKAYYKCTVSLKSEVYEKLNNKKFRELIRFDKDYILKTTEVSTQLRNVSGASRWDRTMTPFSDEVRKKKLAELKEQATTAWDKEKHEKIKDYITGYINEFEDDIYKHNKRFFQECITVSLSSKKQKENFILMKPFLEDFKERWANLNYSEFSFKDLLDLHKASEERATQHWNNSPFEILENRFAESIIFQKLIDIIEKETANAKSYRESTDPEGVTKRT
jgi:hypothetical protein